MSYRRESLRRMTEMPPAVALLAEQLDTSIEFFLDRLDGLTTDEYHWRPVANCWGLVPRGTESTSKSVGGGDFVCEYESGDTPTPPPMRTIAWLVWHLTEMCTRRADYTIGDHKLTNDDVIGAGTAEDGVASLKAALAFWRRVYDEVEPEGFATVGRSAYPDGLDPQFPLQAILWWQNREIIHHAADIGTIRDLYANR
jgi:DinB family protein